MLKVSQSIIVWWLLVRVCVSSSHLNAEVHWCPVCLKAPFCLWCKKVLSNVTLVTPVFLCVVFLLGLSLFQLLTSFIESWRPPSLCKFPHPIKSKGLYPSPGFWCWYFNTYIFWNHCVSNLYSIYENSFFLSCVCAMRLLLLCFVNTNIWFVSL